MVRQAESTRREFVDDLLRGGADVSRLVQRAQPFGLDLGRAHQILLAAPTSQAGRRGRSESAAVAMERATVSVSTVTYRLAKCEEPHQRQPDPSEGLALRLAVLGARLLDWPAHELSQQHNR